VFTRYGDVLVQALMWRDGNLTRKQGKWVLERFLDADLRVWLLEHQRWRAERQLSEEERMAERFREGRETVEQVVTWAKEAERRGDRRALERIVREIEPRAKRLLETPGGR
jgi:hypothetical protein